jgi:hypothetical protein
MDCLWTKATVFFFFDKIDDGEVAGHVPYHERDKKYIQNFSQKTETAWGN